MPIGFQERLVLNQWMLGLFDCASFELLAEHLNRDAMEGYDGENTSYFYTALIRNTLQRQIPDDELLRYDVNIFNHTERLNNNRTGNEKINWKYFQYLALLFTEIYLDKYFRDSDGLLTALNDHVMAFNSVHAPADHIDKFKAEDLRRIAFFQATGSGKTLLMHINIMQYEFYLKQYGREHKLNRIILLTPNDGLSRQHLKEFRKSNLRAKLFDKNSSSGFFTDQLIEIIDIHKLGDKMGDKTVDVAAFEDNNLVLVDEGHRGSSGKEWMKLREQLCKDGFSFEYSATFEQAVNTGNAQNKRKLQQQYAKSILFNYSYKYFYSDGFGKDYNILNLDDGDNNDTAKRRVYLTACILTFYQQMRWFEEYRNIATQKYNLEKPLLVLVGARVNAGVQDVSDLEEYLKFLAQFISNDKTAIADLRDIMKGTAGLYAGNNDIFAQAFDYISDLDPAMVFADIKRRVFNSDGGAFVIEHLKGSSGEIALRLGEGDPFGVINVGESKRLVDACKGYPFFDVRERTFSESYFRLIDEAKSPINILIGAKKFTEGWSSWRVSTMGLLRVGQGEGSEIIQLFGRGVRLKGINFGLKRSGATRQGTPNRAPMKHLKKVETLNIFGVQARYMAQFRAFLEKEGVPADNQMVEIPLPIYCDYDESVGLKLPHLKGNKTFKTNGPQPIIKKQQLKTSGARFVLNWYPKIQVMSSNGAGRTATETKHKVNHLTDFNVFFLDVMQIFFAMQAHKNQLGWYNMNICRADIASILCDTSWYQIEIPDKYMKFSDSMDSDIARWQEIATALMRQYINKIYKRDCKKWEHKHLEYRKLKNDDDNMIWNKENKQNQYVISVKPEHQDDIRAKIKTLGDSFKTWKLNDAGDFAPVEPKLKAFWADKHLYQPLIYIDGKSEHIKIKPTALNEGENDFVVDLRTYIDRKPPLLKGKDIYLLRNQSRGVGVNFFENAEFYPDFILWIVDGDRQYISFIDPHGLRHTGIKNEKINLHKTIKDTQKELAKSDKNVTLNSFIVSTTPYSEFVKLWDEKIEDLAKLNIFFQDGANADYINRIIEKSLM